MFSHRRGSGWSRHNYKTYKRHLNKKGFEAYVQALASRTSSVRQPGRNGLVGLKGLFPCCIALWIYDLQSCPHICIMYICCCLSCTADFPHKRKGSVSVTEERAYSVLGWHDCQCRIVVEIIIVFEVQWGLWMLSPWLVCYICKMGVWYIVWI